jgi:two-component system, chemotaxis family, chemotaxis protein CheY
MSNTGPAALIVDDIFVMRDLLSRMLRSMGFAEMVGAGSAEEALAAVQSRHVDLALVDWNLSGVAGGGVTGGQLVKRMRAANPGLAILMVTGETDQQVVLAARDAGVDGYLVKPVSKADLLKRVKFALQKRGGPPLTAAG